MGTTVIVNQPRSTTTGLKKTVSGAHLVSPSYDFICTKLEDTEKYCEHKFKKRYYTPLHYAISICKHAFKDCEYARWVALEKWRERISGGFKPK